MSPRSIHLLGLALTLSWSGIPNTVAAQGRGQGAIVIRNDAPVYASDTGDKTEAKAPRGYSVAGITVIMGSVKSYMAETENGRAHILYLKGSTEKNALRRRAWMNPEDLAFFTYECGCGEKKELCAPVVTAGWISERWNPCFVEARDKKLAELKAQWEKGDATGTPASASGISPAPQGAGEKVLTNGDIVALFKADLGEELIVSKIQQAQKEALDVSTDSLIQLKKDGIPKSLLDAMVKKVGQRK
jgi:hypothetical protein